MGVGKLFIENEWCAKKWGKGGKQLELVTEQVAPSKWRKTGQNNSRPLLVRDDDGVPGRVDRLKGLGNAIVPQIAELLFRQIKNL
jgi:hypothetical protein